MLEDKEIVKDSRDSFLYSDDNRDGGKRYDTESKPVSKRGSKSRVNIQIYLSECVRPWIVKR